MVNAQRVLVLLLLDSQKRPDRHLLPLLSALRQSARNGAIVQEGSSDRICMKVRASQVVNGQQK